jgi:hypothetical protein
MFSINEVFKAAGAAYVPGLVPVRVTDNSNVCPTDAGNMFASASLAKDLFADPGEEIAQQGAALAIKVCASHVYIYIHTYAHAHRYGVCDAK